jgi:hypothetical protein
MTDFELASMARKVGWHEGRSELRQKILVSVQEKQLTEASSGEDFKKAYLDILEILLQSVGEEPKVG